MLTGFQRYWPEINKSDKPDVPEPALLPLIYSIVLTHGRMVEHLTKPGHNPLSS
jgi:hypothetical protein